MLLRVNYLVMFNLVDLLKLDENIINLERPLLESGKSFKNNIRFLGNAK